MQYKNKYKNYPNTKQIECKYKQTIQIQIQKLYKKHTKAIQIPYKHNASKMQKKNTIQILIKFNANTNTIQIQYEKYIYNTDTMQY